VLATGKGTWDDAGLAYSDGRQRLVSSTAGGNSYGYDCNGNMTTRSVDGQTYTLGYDADREACRRQGHLVSVTGPSYSAAFTYNGDGQRVKQTINNVTTYFVGNYYEKTGSTVTKYYHAGGTRVAVRTGSTVYYLLGDHLGSTSVVTDASGGPLVETRYKPFGEVRDTTDNATLPTKYTFTGHYSYMSDEATDAAGFGLMYFTARFYDPALGRFSSADTVIPGAGDVQAWDRYAYSNNSPLNYVDPSGHWGQCHDDWSGYQCKRAQQKWSQAEQQWAAEAAAQAALALAAQRNASLNSFFRCRDLSGDIGIEAGISAELRWGMVDRSPFACEWIDCALSIASDLLSVGTMTGVPEIAGPAFVLDLGVTLIAVIRTEDAYGRREITNTTRWALNITGILGVVPGPFGLGLSIINTVITFSGYPR
jgi:RHS repeat-associated protein